MPLFLALLFLSSCAFFPEKPIAVTEVASIWGGSKTKHKNFIDNLDSYTTALQISIHASCYDVPDMPDVDIQMGPYTARGAYVPPDNIWVHDDDPKPLAVFGHEYVRHILYVGDDSLWSACSTLQENCVYGWAVHPVSCMWNIAEDLSREYE